ncbi:hypothetical protein AN958_02912 [Leucoagaricus sp. SymC.cos]|nr:hypothetical protein AN958_02912 [Leucoagaricus sp. SymC.cos]
MPILQNQDKIDDLTSKIKDLDEEIHRLMTQRARYRCRLNDLQAETRVLPPETLSIIFHYCNRSRKRLLSLGAVCSHWRDVAWSTPSLWTKCHLIFPWGCVLCWQAEALRLWFSNCPPCGLSLHLHFNGREENTEELYHRFEDDPLPDYVPDDDGIARLVLDGNHHKLRALKFNYLPMVWRTRFVSCLLSGKLSNLRALDIAQLTLSREERIKSENINFLTRLTLHSNHELLDSFPSEQLTSLEIRQVDSRSAFNLLLQLPQLRSFTCEREDLWELDPNPDLSQHEDIILPNLLELEWDFRDDPWSMVLLEHIRLPALKHLYWNAGLWSSTHHRRHLASLAREFFPCLPHLETFKSDADYIWMSDTNSAPFTFLAEGLRELSLLHAEDTALLSHHFQYIVHCLTVPLDQSEARRTTFPSLEKLVIGIDSFIFQVHSGSYVNSLLQIVQSRRRECQAEGARRSQLQVIRFSVVSAAEWAVLNSSFYDFQDSFREIEHGGVFVEVEKGNGDITSWSDFTPAIWGNI